MSAAKVVVTVQDYIGVQEVHICILKLFPISGNMVYSYADRWRLEVLVTVYA